MIAIAAIIPTIKKVLKWGVLVIIVILGATTWILYSQYQKSQDALSKSKANEKAFKTENLELSNSKQMFQFKIGQLSYYSDSINLKLIDAKNKLKIKDKNIQQLQYQLSNIAKVDTIQITDTIFNTNVNIDTIIKDEWYALKLKLKYPNEVVVAPTFISEKVVVMFLKKETIDPPRKTWFGRLFQKKHKVMQVEIVESSPYIQNKQNRFVEIIK